MVKAKTKNERTLGQLHAPRAKIWNGWCHSPYLKHGHDGWIIHAFEEGVGDVGLWVRALCGVRLIESGFINLADEEWQHGPSCIRCRNILRKRGLLPQKDEK